VRWLIESFEKLVDELRLEQDDAWAMRLMQTGDLHAATAAIQRGLTGRKTGPLFTRVRRPGAGSRGSMRSAAC
jgi:hypothetical protein